jgi:hypothetical protein
MIVGEIGVPKKFVMAFAFAVGALFIVVAVLWVVSWRRLYLQTGDGPHWNDPDVFIILTSLIAAIAWGVWWLWWMLPIRHMRNLTIQVHDPTARADVEDNIRKTVGQALGGVAVLIGATVAYLQFLQQQSSAHDLLISNQVAKSFEQLAGEKAAMRLGGIYGLEGVMNTAPEYYKPVLKALCAFVRDGTSNATSVNIPAAEIQAALRVIGRRTKGVGIVDLEKAHISNADLNYADLRGARLSGTVLLGAQLQSADLRGAKLDDANLSGADLMGAALSTDYEGVRPHPRVLSKSVTYLRRINLSKAILRYADFRDAILSDANLTGSNPEDADLRGASLNDANLSGAYLRSVKLDNQAQLDRACGVPSSLP